MTAFIIGDGSSLRSISTVVYFKRKEKAIQDVVSSNGRLFWVKSKLLGVSFLIMKNTDQGLTLQKMLDNQEVTENEIIDFLDNLALKNISVEKLKNVIEEEKSKAYRAGEINIKKQFQKLISI